MKRTLKTIFTVWAVAVVALTSACGAAETSPDLTITPHSELPTNTPRISTATAPILRTVSPQTTPLSAPGSDWRTFSTAGVQFSAPATWQEQAPGVLEGPDGFAHLSTPPLDGAAPGAACMGEANRAKPGRFGQLPEIRDLYENASLVGCLILPSSDQPAARRGESLLLLWSPSARQPNARLALRADRNHIEAIAASLSFQNVSAPAPSNCDYSVQGQPPNSISSGGLRITEYAVAASPAGGGICDPLADPPAFHALASSGEPAAHTARILDEQFSSQRLARMNQRLAPFGIHIRTIERRFAVDQNGVKLHANLSWIGPLSVNASGSDFRLPLVDGYDSGNYILSPSGLQRQEGWDILLFDRVFPVFAGDDLISLAYDYQVYPRQINNPALLNILKNGQVIDTWSVSSATLDGGPVRALRAWQGHWLLELPGIVLEDGQILSDRLGYSEMFTWRLIDERPFYFFRKDGQVRISYDEQVLEPGYDEVLHQALGGSAILLRLKAYENGLLFYARRGDTWYYVIIGT